MTDQVIRELERLTDSPLTQIGALIDGFRAGELTEEAAMDSIARITRNHALQQPVYQKPWG